MLSVRNLCKRYPDFSLKDVGFDVEEGFITGFIGKNGSGKTTTLKSMLNLVIPDSGRVTVFGRDINEAEAEIKQELAFMSGGIRILPPNQSVCPCQDF
ncbi:MAG TPA: ATP-binding cassette domain-containing protein [Eubacteriales bacterium]|nr:ATP-binding cassette domain-containing protein [Eubacteriales bacterium]